MFRKKAGVTIQVEPAIILPGLSKFPDKQSKVASTRVRIKAVVMLILSDWKDGLVHFCENTTIHGFNHIVSARVHYMERVFWGVAVLSAIIGATLLGSTQLSRFQTKPTVVSIKKGFRDWSTTFPALTVCLTDRVDLTRAENFIRKTWNVTKDDEERFDYYSGFIRLVATVSFRSNLRLFWKYEHDHSLIGLPLMTVASSVSPTSGLHARLHTRGPVTWVPVMTEMGICRTFNSVFSRYQSVETWSLQQKDPEAFSRAVSDDELVSCPYKGKQCYARISIINSTGTYYVHSPWELAETTSVSTGPVEGGEEIEAVYRALQVRSGEGVRNLAVYQRGCRFPTEKISAKIPAYSNALCQIDCRSRMSHVFCGCRPFFYIVGNGKACDAAGMACLGRSMEILVNLPTNLARCQCVPQCTEINYVPYDQRTSIWNSSHQTIFDRRASVRLALQMPKVLMHKDVIFSLEDLIGSFGGVSALCLGVSTISVVEILFCIMRPLIRMFLRARNNMILDYAN